MSWVEETLINAFCGARDAAALDAAQMGALSSTEGTAAAAEAACRAALARGAEALAQLAAHNRDNQHAVARLGGLPLLVPLLAVLSKVPRLNSESLPSVRSRWPRPFVRRRALPLPLAADETSISSEAMAFLWRRRRRRVG